MIIQERIVFVSLIADLTFRSCNGKRSYSQYSQNNTSSSLLAVLSKITAYQNPPEIRWTPSGCRASLKYHI
jgi:hypothetical protein